MLQAEYCLSRPTPAVTCTNTYEQSPILLRIHLTTCTQMQTCILTKLHALVRSVAHLYFCALSLFLEAPYSKNGAPTSLLE